MATLPRYSHSGRGSQADLRDRPASGNEFKTFVATSGAIALFYLFCASALAWIGCVLAFYVLGCLAAIYVIGGILPAILAMERLAGVILRSLRLIEGPNWHMRLRRDEARALYALADEMAAKIGVEPPEDIFLEMSADAAVRLLGNHTGYGGSKLYLGYDLLAVLTKSELECVVAHELAHCKLMARGHKRWVGRGLDRAYQLRNNLARVLAEYQHKKVKFHTAWMIQHSLGKLISLMNRVYAEFSRANELAADRLAAEHCGTDIYAATLVRIDTVEYKRQAIDWRDRKIYTQRSESFSEWLRGKLTPIDEAERERIESHLLRRTDNAECSTHPPLGDRIGALPPGPARLASAEPSMALLSNPDDVARDYIQHTSHIISEEERKATSAAKKMANKKAKAAVLVSVYTPGQTVGVVAIILGLFVLMIGIVLCFCEIRAVPGALLLACAFLGPGWLVYVKFARHEASPLPSPPYGLWREGLISDLRKAPIDEWRDEVEHRVCSLLPEDVRGKGRVSAFWAEVCYGMLAQCDFRAALVASERCLAADKNRFEGLMTQSISLAWLGDKKGSSAAMNKAYSAYRFGKSMGWGLGWAFILCESWRDAEVYLLKSVELYPEDPTVLAALSISQRKQGKLHEATDSARRAVATSPRSVDVRKTLVNTLLDAGQPKDALAELDTLSGMEPENFDMMLCTIYASGLCGDVERSVALALRMEELFPEEKTALRLGHVLDDAGCTGASRGYYEKALGYGFYPEALYALSRMEYEAGDFAKARELLTSALDCTKAPGDGSVGPLVMIESICTTMLTTEDASDSCRGYQAVIDLGDSPVAADSMTLLVCAESREDVGQRTRWLHGAMCPGAQLPETAISIEELPEDRQPKDPQPPGIHRVQIR